MHALGVKGAFREISEELPEDKQYVSRVRRCPKIDGRKEIREKHVPHDLRPAPEVQQI
ncbi:hypothetical protein [Methylocystis parvus]|uniref:hypothetical protein n=1 Tax=Methylocystis parvus TaxID=134 RepID=UPI003C78F386